MAWGTNKAQGAPAFEGTAATRIPFVGADLALTDSADLTFDDATNILSCAGPIRAGKTAAATPSVFGEQLASATGSPHQVEFGNTTGDTHIRVGQSNTRNMGFLWDFNATVGNAFAEWNSFGYGNSGRVNFSRFDINPDSGKDAVMGNGGAAATVLATTATEGFFRIPTCAGTPTGAAVPGALVLDETNDIVYARTEAGWVALN